MTLLLFHNVWNSHDKERADVSNLLTASAGWLSWSSYGQGVKCRCVCRGDSGPDPWSRIHSGHAERGHAVWGSGQAVLQRSSGAGILPQPAGEHDQVSDRIHHTSDAVEKPQEAVPSQAVNYLKQQQPWYHKSCQFSTNTVQACIINNHLNYRQAM